MECNNVADSGCTHYISYTQHLSMQRAPRACDSAPQGPAGWPLFTGSSTPPWSTGVGQPEYQFSGLPWHLLPVIIFRCSQCSITFAVEVCPAIVSGQQQLEPSRVRYSYPSPSHDGIGGGSTPPWQSCSDRPKDKQWRLSPSYAKAEQGTHGP